MSRSLYLQKIDDIAPEYLPAIEKALEDKLKISSDEYKNILKAIYGLGQYKKAGVWGSVIRTCCGPEYPCWILCKDKLSELNTYFLEG